MDLIDVTIAGRRLLCIAGCGLISLFALAWPSSPAQAQVTEAQALLSAEVASAPSADGVPSAGEDATASLRRHIEDMQGRLQAQQEQLDQQATRLKQLEGQQAAPLTDNTVPSTPAEWQPGPSMPACNCPSADPSVATPPGLVLPFCRNSGTCYPRAILGGQYRMVFNAANYDYHPTSVANNQQSQAFINQRLRTWLTIQTNENVEGYVQAQMGHVAWGENYDCPKTFIASGTTDDRVGVMMRYGYLAYHTEDLGRLQAGVQGWQDSFGQTLASSDWDFSVGGLSWVRQFPAFDDAQMKFGIFELVQGDTHLVERTYLLALDLDQPVMDEHSVGVSAYFLPDRGGYSYPTMSYDSAWDVWLGGRFRLALPVVPINGFAIYNKGSREDSANEPTFHHDGVALKLEAGPLPVGPGKVSSQALYSKGGDTAGGGFRTVAQSNRDNFGSEGYWSYLMLVTPQGYTDVNDLGVSLQNRGYGLFTVQGKYEYPIFERLSGTLAVGWLRSDTPNPANGSTEMGTELGHNFTFDFGGGLKADMGAAVLFTGDFYKASAAALPPATLYEAFTRVQLEF